MTEQSEPTASVLLDLTPGTALSGEQIQAVTNLVSSSIQDMEPDQVTVADSSGQVLSAAGQGITAAAGDARSQVETEYETRLAAKRPDRSSTACSAPAAPSSPCAPTSTSPSARPRRRPTPTSRAPRRCPSSTTTEDYTGGGVPVRRRPRPGEHAGRGGERRGG